MRDAYSFLFRSAIVATAWISACSGPPAERTAMRLVDLFPTAEISSTPGGVGSGYERTEWRFSEGDAGAWRALQGIEGLGVVDGALRGTTRSDRPVLMAEPRTRVPATELLHAVEIRARVSAGANLSVYFDDSPSFVLSGAIGNPVVALSTPVVAGDEMRTYVLRSYSDRRAGELDRILVLPTDAAGAEFAVESVRLVFRREHLHAIPSGVGWHGMSEVYRESIVSRAPETVRFQVTLPADPWLDLAVATIDAVPATFVVEVREEGSGEPRIARTEVTAPDAWSDVALDLSDLAGERVTVVLSLESAEPGALGFWGSPAIRSRSGSFERDSPQGVLLVVTDTLRSDHLQAYGYERETAPTLARLGAEGVLFADTLSQGTWTKASVPSILSSLYPTTHTVAEIPDQLPASATTIAEIFREAGHATFGIGSIPFVGQLTNLHQGFEVLHELGASAPTRKTSAEAVERLNAWLETHRDVPFFALLHVADPHAPYRPPQPFENAFAEPGDMDRLEALVARVIPHIAPGSRQRFGMASREELAAAGVDAAEIVRLEQAGYDGSIRAMDDAFARLMARIEELGLRDRVVVAVVADHGTEFLEHDNHFHGHSVYGELNRVPMLIWGPGFVPARGTVGETVQTIDLMPTLVELAGLPLPERAQGESLLPLVAGASERRAARPAITELHRRGVPSAVSIVWDGFKLVRIGSEGRDARYELYDHVEDPLNLNDVAGEHPEVVKRLAETLSSWERYAQSARLDDAEALETLDSAELERLRSLGYVR